MYTYPETSNFTIRSMPLMHTYAYISIPKDRHRTLLETLFIIAPKWKHNTDILPWYNRLAVVKSQSDALCCDTKVSPVALWDVRDEWNRDDTEWRSANTNKHMEHDFICIRIQKLAKLNFDNWSKERGYFEARGIITRTEQEGYLRVLVMSMSWFLW